MTNIALPSERPASETRHNTGLGAALRHARYILGENAVTGFAFGLFLLIVLAALVGPYLVPYDPLASDTAAALKQLILPALTLAIFSLAPIARMTRASMLAVLSSDFVRTARASGLAPFTVVITYAFRNAMLPVITTLGMVFSFLLGANVLVEKVFAWPGIGSYAVEALISSDFAPVQGFVLTMAVMYVLLNLIIDILYGVIDPRVRLEG